MSFQSLRLMNLNAYDRHKALVNQYLLNKPGSTQVLQRDGSRDKRDIDVIRENHHFLWDEEKNPVDTWEARLAKKYYDKLFKEYCICDLTRYKENKVAMRWRIEAEVVSGKGQFSCGNKSCGNSEDLKSWEVNFAYMEAGEKMNALVKLRLCPPCSEKLNYRHKRREAKRKKRKHSPEPEEPAKKVCEETEETEEVPSTSSAEPDESQVWRQSSTNAVEEKSRDEEFQEYFDDLFL